MLVLVGVGLFVFYAFSLSFSASDGSVELGQGWYIAGAAPHWHVEAGYELRARVGLAVGAVLVVAGLFVRKAAK
ncbi:exported hypothetical protein [Candidatus Sulfopaludibacter sp. SbA4]|nr:exported hypothetical protein [Candidatus Sulfopaludibacter sp. SbA4]